MNKSVGLGLPEYAFNTSQTILIVGAGLAGCAIAHALATRGYHCRVIDQYASSASATSALPSAVVRPAISRDQFFSDYFNYAFDLCCTTIDEKQFTQCGSLELTDRNNSNVPTTASYFSEFVTASDASILANTKLTSNAIHIKEAGFVHPQALCNHWLQHKAIEFKAASFVSELNKTQNGWQLLSDTGTVIDESRVVVLATAADTTRFNVTSALPLQCAVGQIDLFETTDSALQRIINGNGYLLPDQHGVWCGATHHPLADNHSPSGKLHTKNDSLINKATAALMAPELTIGESASASFAAVRTFTPDRLPMVGAVHDYQQYRENYNDLKHGKPDYHYPPPRFHKGLYLAAGLGSRGATQALLIGELISHLVAGEHLQVNSPKRAYNDFLQGLHPARFLIRALRRNL